MRPFLVQIVARKASENSKISCIEVLFTARFTIHAEKNEDLLGFLLPRP